MDKDVIGFAPSFPPAIIAGLTLLSLILYVLAARRVQGRSAQFVLGAIWLRIIFDAWPFITIQPMVAGMTPNALLSVATVGVGLLVIDLRHLFMRWLWPVWALIAAMIISGAFNGLDLALFDTLMRMMYLLVMTAAIYEAFVQAGRDRLSTALMAVFAILPILQIAAFLVPLTKITRSDASVAFAGGFNHEVNFSLALAVALIPLAINRSLSAWVRVAYAAALLIALLGANYRTAIVALAPVMIAVLLALVVRQIRRDQRLITAGLAIAGSIGLLLAAPIEIGERWAAVVEIVQNPDQAALPPESFTTAERRFASGRNYLYSVYLHGFLRADPTQQAIGHGADSWKAISGVYAQNTLLSYLYEFGVLGALCAVAYWLSLCWLAIRSWSRQPSGLIIMTLSMIVLNMSTMPMNLLQGLMLYALLGGALSYNALARKPAPVERNGRQSRRVMARPAVPATS